MYYVYEPDERVCPTQIKFHMNGGRIYGLEFVGGCEGMHIANARLIDGMAADDVIRAMEGIGCPVMKLETSCSDQVAKAVRAAQAKAAAGVTAGSEDAKPGLVAVSTIGRPCV